MSAPQYRRTGDDKPRGRISKAERKRQLLAQAKQLFAAHGYPSTTLAQIAEAAGVSEGVLQRHFPTKSSLFLEVLQQVREATLVRWQAELVAVPDSLAQLHTIVDTYLSTVQEHPLEFRIVHRTLVEATDEEITAAVRSYYLDCEALLTRVISEGQQSGVFRRSFDPRVGAWELIRSALGYTLTLPLEVPLYQQADYLPQAIECLLQCLLKTDV